MNDNKEHILEKGYRPTNRLNTADPPKSGSAVPPVPISRAEPRKDNK